MADLIRVDGRVALPERLPVVALRDLVFFPYVALPILVGRHRSLTALEEARDQHDGLIVLLAQKDPAVDDPSGPDLFRIGTVARVTRMSTLPDRTCRVSLEGLGRVRIRRLSAGQPALRAAVEPLASERETEDHAGLDDLDRRVTEVRRLYREYARVHERIPDDLPDTLEAGADRVRFCHLVAGHVIVPSLEKQEVLEAESLTDALEMLRELLTRELEILRIERKLDRQIQMRLGGDDLMDLSPELRGGPRQAREDADEWEELEERIERTDLPAAVRERADKELARLRKLSPVAPEAAVIRNHLDWIVALPWSQRSVDNLDVRHAAEILEAEHFGLDEVKDRILDHVAVLSMVREIRGPILCLAGPPGVGKTSLGRSIANALGREFVRVSLGGVRDEAEIRGHRRTYVGALPGRIVQGMRRSGTRNPVFLLDEVDKLARDFHGDPGAALLEVLDPEQNRAFTDHYLEVEYDLSDVLFVATANTLQDIPEPLRDRMEIIRLPGYLMTEKHQIAARYLWPRQLQGHGLDGVVLEADAVGEVIERYTREAGVRELERRFSRIARKLARARADGGSPPARVRREDLPEILGPPPYHPPDRDQDGDRVGISNGLAWTATGGELLDVEVAIVPGTGQLRLTGTLGDVMKESAQAAVTYARSRSTMLGLASDFHERIDVHIHLPEGATPKDGPSAGITIASALISALTDRPTRSDFALTGEITLRGRVLAVGGIKEKAVAALRNGVRTVVLPAANATDLERLPAEVTDAVRFQLVRTMDEVLEAVLGPSRRPMGRPVRDTDRIDVAVPRP